LFVDILHVNGVTFLLTLFKNIWPIAIRHIKERKEEHLLEAVDDVFEKSNEAVVEMKEFHAGSDHCCLEQHLDVVAISPIFCVAQEHLPEIEKLVRVVKERCRAACHSIGSLQLLAQDSEHQGIGDSAKQLNSFPPMMEHQKVLVLELQLWEGHWIMKRIAKWLLAVMSKPTIKTIPQIQMTEERANHGTFLKTLDNIQGRFDVLDSKKGQSIRGHFVQEISITKEGILQVEELAKKDGFTCHAESIF